MTSLYNIIGYGCRSLQAWQQHGRPHSELLRSQREEEGGSTLGGPLRYPDTLIFWVQCQQVSALECNSTVVAHSDSPPYSASCWRILKNPSKHPPPPPPPSSFFFLLLLLLLLLFLFSSSSLPLLFLFSSSLSNSERTEEDQLNELVRMIAKVSFKKNRWYG